MLNFFSEIIEYIGFGNCLSIILFLIGTFFAFYFYFKSFYRLVYSHERIVKTERKLNDLIINETTLVSRILFYNNGRKTLTSNEIKNLEIAYTDQVFSIRILEGKSKIKTEITNNIISIDFEYLDSNEYILLEITHNGQLEISGRISETGDILHVETKAWVIINVIFMLFIVGLLAFYTSEFINKNEVNYLKPFLNIIATAYCGYIMRFVHKLFFIPDKLTSKYLDTKDKWHKEFKVNY